MKLKSKNPQFVMLPFFLALLLGSCAGNMERRDIGFVWSSETAPWGHPDSKIVDGKVKTDQFAAKKDVIHSDATANACAASFSLNFTYGSTMVICASTANATFNQCDAASACNTAAGWEICTASKFIARGGVSTASATKAWMKGCLRDDKTVLAPDDRFCTCADGTTSAYNQGYDCTSNQAVQSTSQNLGVVSNNQCYKLGYELDKAQTGYWYFYQAASKLSATVCCK